MTEEQDRRKLEGEDSVGFNLQYPTTRGLGDDTEGQGHHMIFEIFDVEGLCLESITNAFKGTETTDQSDDPDALEGEQQETSVSSLASNPRTTAGQLADFITTNAGVAFDQVAEELTRLNQENKKIKGNIVLYVPEAVNTSYGLDWQMSDDMVGVALLEDVFKLIRANQTGANTEGILGSIAEQVALQAAPGTIDSISSLIGVNFGGQAAIENLTKKVRNPHIAFLFKGVNQRTFSFEFNFTPQNLREVEEVHNIIKTFKKHALPELDQSQRFLRYPSLFDISYRSNFNQTANETSNGFLYKLKPSVITNIGVDYSGGGVFSTFEDQTMQDLDGKIIGGAPATNIKLTLDFAETSLLTRQDIVEGH